MADDTTEPISIEEKSALIVDAKHVGDMNFFVYLLDTSSGEDTTMFNAIGDFEGRAIEPVEPGRYIFNVTYGESYSLEPTGFEEDEVREPPASITGYDADVIPIRSDKLYQVTLEANHDMNIFVRLHDSVGEEEETIINAIGPGTYASTVTTPGFGFLSLDLQGEWTLELEAL